ncbi:MAG: Phospho-N-acetylmuramoyl-pentapeptide-transferase [Candidatus Doudnabacteria bacterium]|nr:Phospho-N-acetylmuramoyl-pentapeptide-transferase [Candidatus Doudnabacteria bacterium]
MISYHLLKVLILTAISFAFALLMTPFLIKFLVRLKVGKNIRNDGSTPIFSKLHAAKQGTPTMAGVLIWGTLTVLIVVFWVLDRLLGIQYFHLLNFLTRKETLLPLGALLGAAMIGLFDDILDLRGRGFKGRGFRFRYKLILYTLVAAIGAYWFYYKLGFNYVGIPFAGNLTLGWLYIPFFILVVVGTSFSVNQTDGLDGLAGGALLMAFFAYGLLAYLEGRYDLASFIGVLIGALLAFLWFNIFPASFFMGDTGSMGLGTVLAVIAFLVNGSLLLPVIGIVFLLEALSYFGQLFWRKVFHKKLFLSSPLHHHLEASGWPEAKVTMRLWIIALVFGILGVIIHFVSII